jgi:hypothetical protein
MEPATFFWTLQDTATANTILLLLLYCWILGNKICQLAWRQARNKRTGTWRFSSAAAAIANVKAEAGPPPG